MQSESSLERERAHAKLLTFGHRQVLAFLQRGQDEELTVVLQLWIASSDEQLQIALTNLGEDERAQVAFDAINDEALAELLEILGVPAMIAEHEARG